MVQLSVILPTYNEAGNIVDLVNAIIEQLPTNKTYEIIVVDDNSPDGTSRLVETAFKENSNVKMVLRTENKGLAYSIQHGINLAIGERILIMDTDFSHDPKEINPMLQLAETYDIVSGSRFEPSGGMEDKRRYFASWCFSWFIKIMLGTQLQDTLAGFFIIKKSALNQLDQSKIFGGYGDYYFRLLYFAQQKSISATEHPVMYITRRKGKSKSEFIPLFISYLMAVTKFRFQLWKS
ncbi:MAG: glycosyltransferase [Flavobacteriales bacterium]|nr:glycosyltransferase [Flavobacteriales bacterium]